MARAANLVRGLSYEVTEGPLKGQLVEIVDNTTFPDTHPDRRKVPIMTDHGTDVILPRQLADEPTLGTGQVATPDPVAPVAPVGPSAPTAAPAFAPPPPPAVESPQVEDTMANITDPMDERLDVYRPSATKVKKYIERKMQNGMSDIDFLLTFTSDDYRAENEGRPANVMLKGDTQSGKTFLVEVLAVKWAEALGLPKPMPVFTLSGSSGVTDYDLFGQVTSYTDASGREHLVWLHGVADLAARVGGILYVDECNALAERVTSSLHPLADHRHQFTNRNKAVESNGMYFPEVISASLDLWIIGTFNEGYRGMADQNEAWLNRFRHLSWGYDDKVEKKLIKSPTVHLLGEAVRNARAGNKLRTPVGTAALQRLERDVKHFGVDAALEVFTGLFKPQERGEVQSILIDRSITMLFKDEVGEDRADDNQPF